MSIVLSILLLLVGLANLVLFVMVLIKLFQREGTLKGILGLICALYTFVWGWMKHKELQITNIMIGWTACIIVAMILQVVSQSIVSAEVMNALQY